MSRKNKTDAERQHLSAVAALGCIACRIDGYIELGESQATPHHITTGYGMGEMRNDFETIPLCWKHHQGQALSIHGTPELFKKSYGTESSLLEQTLLDLVEHKEKLEGN